MSLPRRARKDPKKVQSAKKLSLDESLLVYHLARGGFGVNEVAEVAGIRLHQQSFDDLIDSAEWLISGPIPIPVVIKCNECGSRITSVPCVTCPKKPNYSLVKT